MGWFGTTAEKVPDYVQAMRDAHGETAAREIMIDGSPHVMIFPNLFIAEIQLFVIQPLAVDLTVQHVTCVQFEGGADLNRRLLQQTIGSVGPAGFLLADDSEMYERNQRGVAVRTPEWVLLSRGAQAGVRRRGRPDRQQQHRRDHAARHLAALPRCSWRP